MTRLSRQAIVVGCMLIAGGASYGILAARAAANVIQAGFWFEAVSFDSSRLAGPITPAEIETIASVARAEIAGAYAGWRISFSDRRDATYRIRVVQELRDRRFNRYIAVAGESRAISGFGGSGAVNFFFLASGAVAYAPENADRAALIDAIGKGIGRTAVHEFAHQLLPTASIHHSRDIASYEYASAARREQFPGVMHWSVARPLLERRLGRR
jgi:hypothetical protein